MHNTTLALVLLSLFTTSDKAAEIEGDLLEQSRRHGRLWFWLQVKLTCVALFFHNVRAEPGKLLLGGFAVYELALKIDWWVLNPVRVALWRGLHLSTPQQSIFENSVHTVAAFILAMLVTRLSPRHGGQITFIAAGFLSGRVLLQDGWFFVPRLLAFVVIPAVLGVLLMKWMELRRNGAQELRASR